MGAPNRKEKIAKDIAAIDSQMAALAKRKQKCLSQALIADSSENQTGMEGRREALAEALAEGIVYLGERGLLPLTEEPFLSLPAQVVKVKSPNGKQKNRGL
jgi:hypothetical protein